MTAALPLLPDSAPFAPEHIEALNAVMARTNAEQRQWLSGFLAGYHAATAGAPCRARRRAARSGSAHDPLCHRIGQCRGRRRRPQEGAGKQGFAAKLLDMAEVSPARSRTSATSWSSPAPGARAIRPSAPPSSTRRSWPRTRRASMACALPCSRSAIPATSTSARWGAASICASRRWAASASRRGWSAISTTKPGGGLVGRRARGAGQARRAGRRRSPRAATSSTSTSPRRQRFALLKANPFPAEITESINLNSSRSTKQTIHLEVSLEGSGLTFEPGDSLGIVPENDPAMVEAVLRAGLDGDDRCAASSPASSTSRCCRVRSWRPTPRSIPTQLRELLAGDGWRAYVEGRQIVDLLEDFPAKLAPAQLTGLLRKLPPRLYSVASALAASRTRRISWSASCATKVTAARGAASLRASSPSACAPATTGSRSTSSRTRTSACRTIRTGRSS